MPIILDPQEPAINRGIKTVGIGKKGSKDLPPELVSEILTDLKADKISPAAKGAFLAGLLAKGLQPHEEVLTQAFPLGVFEDSQKFINAIAGEAPDFIKWVCVQLLNGQTLDQNTAYDLGKFLFSDQPGDGARGLVASFLRVRYETGDEYAGLLRAIVETLEPPFTSSPPQGLPIVQIAEPFDGVDHSYMITPLLGQYIQSLGYRVIHMVGNNSGPKFEMNLWDIAQALGEKEAQGNQDLGKPAPIMGWFFHQSKMSLALDRWVQLRHQIIKRPFLATLERFVNPAQADILIASAFHAPYGEKMLAIAELAGFKGIIIVKNGIEGSIGFSLKRPVRVLLSKKIHGTYQHHEMTFEAEQLLGLQIPLEEKIEHPNAKNNALLIKNYLSCGESGYKLFDWRIKSTNSGLGQALNWIRE